MNNKDIQAIKERIKDRISFGMYMIKNAMPSILYICFVYGCLSLVMRMFGL